MTTRTVERPPTGRRTVTRPIAVPARPRHTELIAGSLIAAGALPILLMWWQDTIPGSLSTTGGYLIAAGRAAGLLTVYLLLVLTTLMARIPWVVNRLGADSATRIHRALGEYTVTLAVCHVALVITGFAVTDHTGVLHQAAVFELDYPDIMMSTAALGLLLMTGVLSARAIRRRLAYETWHFAHLYVYLAIALAFSHEFVNGQDFSASLVNRVLWSSAHVAVALAVITFRVALPMIRSLRHDVRVHRVVEEGPGVVSVHLTGRHLDRLGAQPGQYLRWRFIARGHWWESHPYSLSAAPTASKLRITVKAVGDGSARLAALKPGVRVWFEGPYGSFTARRRRDSASRVLLVAAGVGITPIRAMFETLPGRGRSVILFYRASRTEDLVLYRELQAIAKRRGFGLYPLVGPRSEQAPLDPATLARAAPDLASREIYVSGPPGFTEAAAAQLRRAGATATRIHTEGFGW